VDVFIKNTLVFLFQINSYVTVNAADFVVVTANRCFCGRRRLNMAVNSTSNLHRYTSSVSLVDLLKYTVPSTFICIVD